MKLPLEITIDKIKYRRLGVFENLDCVKIYAVTKGRRKEFFGKGKRYIYFYENSHPVFYKKIEESNGSM